MEYNEKTYVNGYIERKKHGRYEGRLSIEGIDISPIEGLYFKNEGTSYLWLKRQEVLEYDISTCEYKKRKANPFWECYLTKQLSNGIAYKGFFVFCRFRFAIIGIYDTYMKDVDRLNLYVERLPMEQQTIINSVNKKKKEINNDK